MTQQVTCPSPDAPLDEILGFALTYDAYTRLGAGPQHLQPLIDPVMDSLQSDETVPDWAGVDLLRGTLFFLQRMTHHWGEVPPEQAVQMRILIDAIDRRAGGLALPRDPSV